MNITLYKSCLISFFKGTIIHDIKHKKTNVDISSFYPEHELNIGAEKNLYAVSRILEMKDSFSVNLAMANNFHIFTVLNYGTDISHSFSDAMELTYKPSCPSKKSYMYKFTLQFHNKEVSGYLHARDQNHQFELLNPIAKFCNVDIPTFYHNLRENIIEKDNSFTSFSHQH